METNKQREQKRKRYDEGFKRDCVALFERSGKSIRAFSAEMGVNHWCLRDWMRLYRPPAPRLSAQESEAELVRLRRENESLKAQRDVLKKALGILVEAPGNVTRG
jgi:transposase